MPLLDPARAPDRVSTTRATRGGALRTAALVAGGALATPTAVGAADRLSAAPSAAKDVRILNLLLLVERVEVAFYEAAPERGILSGELEELARTVLAHERGHLAYLQDALGDVDALRHRQAADHERARAGLHGVSPAP